MASKKPVTTPMHEIVLVENTSIAKSSINEDSQLVTMGQLKAFMEQVKGN